MPPSSVSPWLAWVADTLGARVRALTGSRANLDEFTQPLGDPGLFGPDSQAWRVHAHFVAMMVGGLSSLIVQSLHPRALAAVWDHSDFRHQLKARLGRTAHFVAATTYGGQDMAQQAIARVNAIHARIQGVDQAGEPYVANEPALLRWVHLAEVSAFLSAYQHLARTPLSPAQADAYVAEMTRVGQALGATDLPLTWRATQAALEAYVPALRFDARAQEIYRILMAYPADWIDRPLLQLMQQVALDILPESMRRILGQAAPCELTAQLRRRALQVAGEPVQWMLDHQGVAAIARARVQGQRLTLQTMSATDFT